MKIKQELRWFNGFVESLSDTNLKILNHTLSEIKSSIQAKPTGSLIIPYSLSTELGLQMIFDRIIFNDGSITQLSDFCEGGEYYTISFEDNDMEKLTYMSSLITTKISTLGISPNIYPKSNKVEINGVTLDLNRGKMKYVFGNEIDINRSSREVELLLVLIEHQNKIMSYEEIVEAMKLTNNDEVERYIHKIKNRVIKLLVKTGMDKEESDKFIRLVNNEGIVAQSPIHETV